jgi:hypothetical protein
MRKRLETMPGTQQKFTVVLSEFGDGSYGFVVPFDVYALFGSRMRVPVCGTIDGVPYRGSVVPYGGRHHMSVSRRMRAVIRKTSGDNVTVVMDIDLEPRVVEIPEDLLWALDANDHARAVFDRFGSRHRREYVNWIESARRADKRAQRVQEALRRMVAEQQVTAS